MNKIIPDGSICLFEKYRGGSRNGLITLVQMTNYKDNDYGSNYTIKEYISKKTFQKMDGGMRKLFYYQNQQRNMTQLY